ncbi:MAG TPA: hypothetical protein VN428_02825 [Bryobacteraceae bacterium]|nr:hypothetical protein [Bryobacteraceae bacterium]
MPLDLSREVVLRWDHQDPAIAPLLKEGGIDAVVAEKPDPAFRQACQAVGMRVLPSTELTVAGLEGFRSAKGAAAFAEGLWPGVQRTPVPPDADVLASASRLPWVDANGFRVAWLRALCPEKPAALGYVADASSGLARDRLVPFDSLELALVEARAYGGNYVLSVDQRYRTALLEGRSPALADWKRLGRTAFWLKKHSELFGLPALPQITMLVDDGESAAELANLMFRQNASPAVEPVGKPPAPDPSRRLAVVAASISVPSPDIAQRILAHAGAGATVVTDRGEGPPWWRAPGLQLAREEKDRETYTLGRGRVVAYKDAISDPSEFALDVIDLITHPRRAVRMWNAQAAIATATAGPPSGPFAARAVLLVVNYGRPLDYEVMCHVQGSYSSAVLLRPESDSVRLGTARRGSATEVILPELRRLGVVLLDGLK